MKKLLLTLSMMLGLNTSVLMAELTQTQLHAVLTIVTTYILDGDVDTDGDGIPDSTDTDDDNDGVPDTNDAFPLDASESVDTDGDGIGNNADTDDDNDGVPDSSDALPLDPTESVDTDGDGVGDNADPAPLNARPSANDFNITLDVNLSTISVNWKSASAVSDAEGDVLSATITVDGTEGNFVLSGDMLTYLKTVDGNATDHATLSISDGHDSIEIEIALHPLYWKQISGGVSHTVAIKSDGTLWGWGNNGYGQLGDGTTIDSNTPVQEESNSTTWTRVDAGSNHTVAIKSDGTLWGWGRNSDGELGNGTTTTSHIPVQEESNSTNWTRVVAGSFHTVALKSDGTLWGWGKNSSGQLGDGTTTNSTVPVQEDSNSSWTKVATKGLRTIAIKSDGTLWGWGKNSYGQLGNGTNTDSPTPVQEVSNSTNWTRVAAGTFHTVAIKSDGTLWGWGRNTYGQLGNGSTTDSDTPVQESTLTSDWTKVAAGSYHTVALKNDGTLWAWGRNTFGELGNGSSIESHIPVQEDSNSTNWTRIAVGGSHTVALKSDGRLWGWGNNSDGQLGKEIIDRAKVPVKENTPGLWSIVSIGAEHTVAIKSDGTLWGWGRNAYGQLGNGSTTDSDTPVQESTLTSDWTKVAAGNLHTVAIKSDGTLWAWGYNSDGQLGNGSIITSHIAVQEESNSTNWTSIATGYNYIVAIKSDGTLWGWGNNSDGQLGNGSTTTSHVPVQEDSNSTNWTRVAAGRYHTVALKNDGTLWEWGDNSDGQLGNGTTTDSATPVQEESNSTNWTRVAAGRYHTVALKNDGTLWAWGSNGYGQLGDGTTTNSDAPVQEESNSTNWTRVAAGSYHTVAIKNDGTLWGWGKNDYGQLGNGTTIGSNVPVQVESSSTTWSRVGAGGNHNYAKQLDGSFWRWGNNRFGQLNLFSGKVPSEIIFRVP